MARKLLPLHYTFLLDASGSMRPDAEEVRQELNKQIKELKDKHEEMKRPCYLSIHVFNSQLITIRDCVQVIELKELRTDEYQPRGCTALLDAMGFTLENLKGELGRKSEREGVVVVFTDGFENMSKAFTMDSVHSLVEEFNDAKGWTISFIGSDWKGIAEGRLTGIQKKHAHYYPLNEKLKAMKDIRNSIARFYGQETSAFMVQRSGDYEIVNMDSQKASNT